MTTIARAGTDSPASAALTAQQEAAIAALLAHPTITAAAAAIGHDESTVRRYLKIPAVAAAYQEARREVFAQASSRLLGACTKAITTLEAICGDDAAPHAARVSAARAILENARGALEIDDITARLARLEDENAR